MSIKYQIAEQPEWSNGKAHGVLYDGDPWATNGHWLARMEIVDAPDYIARLPRSSYPWTLGCDGFAVGPAAKSGTAIQESLARAMGCQSMDNATPLRVMWSRPCQGVDSDEIELNFFADVSATVLLKTDKRIIPVDLEYYRPVLECDMFASDDPNGPVYAVAGRDRLMAIIMPITVHMPNLWRAVDEMKELEALGLSYPIPEY